MKLYQLVAIGPQDTWNRKHSISSKRVFRTQVEALGYQDEFAAKCVDGSLTGLDSVEKIVVIELELEEG